jgi:hypothetical protein
MIIGYACTSKEDQRLGGQLVAVKAVDVEKDFADRIIGTAGSKHELAACWIRCVKATLSPFPDTTALQALCVAFSAPWTLSQRLARAFRRR